jgi:hypothetical protein
MVLQLRDHRSPVGNPEGHISADSSRRRRLVLADQTSGDSDTVWPDTCSHAIPATQEEAAALIAGLVFAA